MKAMGDAVKRSMKQWLLPVVVMAGQHLSAQSGVRALTLRDAVQLALRENPQVLVARIASLQSVKEKDIVRSALLPQGRLAATEDIRRYNIETALGPRTPGLSQHIGPFHTLQAGPAWTITVFDLEKWRNLQAARQDVVTSKAEERTTREDIVASVVSQYLLSLRSAAAEQAAQSRVDLAVVLAELAKDQLARGLVAQIDFTRADVQLQQERQSLIDAQVQRNVDLYVLSRILNLPPEQNVQLTDALHFTQTPALQVPQLLTEAMRSRPELQSAQSQLLTAQFRKQAAIAQALPTIDIDGKWQRDGRAPARGIPGYSYEATFTMPLFTGGRIAAERARAELEIRRAEQELRSVTSQVVEQIKAAVVQADAARNQVDVANQQLRLAQDEITQARDRFRAGVANNIEVTTAQDALARANDSQIGALFRFNQARADIAKAVGNLEDLYTR